MELRPAIRPDAVKDSFALPATSRLHARRKKTSPPRLHALRKANARSPAAPLHLLMDRAPRNVAVISFVLQEMPR